jgi:hypothetical protein
VTTTTSYDDNDPENEMMGKGGNHTEDMGGKMMRPQVFLIH